MKKYSKKLISLLSAYKKELFVMLSILFASTGLGYILPYISRNIIDKGLMGKNFKVLSFYCCVSVAVSFAASCCRVIQEKNRLKICNGIVYKLERESFDHLLKIKMSYYQNENVSAIYSTLRTDISVISSAVDSSTFEILTEFFTAIGGAAALYSIHWKLLAAVLLMMPLNFLITFIMSKANYKLVEEFNDQNKKYHSWFSDTIQGIREVRLFGLQKLKQKTLDLKQKDLLDINIKQSMMMVKNSSVIMFLLESLSALLYLIAGCFLINNELSIGEVVAFQAYALMITNPIVSGLKLIFSISSLTPSLERYFDFIEYPEEESGGAACPETGSIEFSDVEFSYSDDKKLLSNLNISVRQGEKAAVLGRNGVGKTTVLNLLLRMISPDKGLIKYSGNDISNYDIIEYRKLFGVVSQDVFLFNTSIRENICLDTLVNGDELAAVIQSVGLDSLIDERGLDYQVGENGSLLSGGQKQKIAIARALICKRPVIILDEATSNLDHETIALLSELFKNEMKDTTVICVTHTDSVADMFEKKIMI